MKSLRLLGGLLALGAGVAATTWFLGGGESAKLRADRDRLEQERRQLTQVVERLTREQRVAEVIVTAQPRDEHGNITHTEIQFIELDRDGHPLAPRPFCLPGHVLYFDGFVIKFAEELVAAGDPLRGQSIMLFRRIFSDVVAPENGRPVDDDGDVPNVFRINPKPGEFEQNLWKRFWSYATDPELAKRDGVRIAQGEAVYAPMTAGQRWTLTLESNGGLNLHLTAPTTAP
jgi:hypothetical protein